jgi:hypothetical protein
MDMLSPSMSNQQQLKGKNSGIRIESTGEFRAKPPTVGAHLAAELPALHKLPGEDG